MPTPIDTADVHDLGIGGGCPGRERRRPLLDLRRGRSFARRHGGAMTFRWDMYGGAARRSRGPRGVIIRGDHPHRHFRWQRENLTRGRDLRPGEKFPLVTEVSCLTPTRIVNSLCVGRHRGGRSRGRGPPGYLQPQLQAANRPIGAIAATQRHSWSRGLSAKERSILRGTKGEIALVAELRGYRRPSDGVDLWCRFTPDEAPIEVV